MSVVVVECRYNNGGTRGGTTVVAVGVHGLTGRGFDTSPDRDRVAAIRACGPGCPTVAGTEPAWKALPRFSLALASRLRAAPSYCSVPQGRALIRPLA